MKKTLCFITIILLTSVASATTINLGVISVDYTVYGNDVLLSFITNSYLTVDSISFGALTDNGAGGTFNLIGSDSYAFWNMSFYEATVSRASDSGVGDDGTLINASANALPSGAVYTLVTFSYTATEFPTTMSLLDDHENGYPAEVKVTTSWGTSTQSLAGDFTLVPEPATIALLSLGGFLIRKRK
jgi:hypothetical protein